MNVRRLICSILCASALGAASTQCAIAEDARATESVLEEITVTARKREESAQDVPLALTALSEETLANRHVVNLTDLPQLAPNLSIHEAFASPSVAVIYLRGFGTSTNDPSVQPPVSVNIDGIYQASLAGSVVDMFDLERVEVLRGPQNTLIGKNSPAGAINFYTKRPTGEWGGNLQVDYGRFERVEVRGSLDFPLVDDVLAGRVSSYFDDGGDYIDNLAFPGREHGGKQGHTLRAGLLFTPTEDIEWYLSGSFIERRDSVQGYRNISTDEAYPPLVGPSLSCTLLGFCSAFPTRFTTAAGVEGEPKLETSSFTSNFSWHLPQFALASNTGYKHLSHWGVEDVDGLPFPLFNAPKVETIANDFSQEFRLNSTEGGWLTFDDRFDWLLGLYYVDQDYVGNRTFVVPGPTVVSDNQTGTIKSLAAFAHGIYELTPAWNVSVGVRRTRDELDHTFVPTGFPENTRTADSVEFSNTSIELGTQYELAPGRIVFVRYAEGYAAGGFNGVPATPENVPPYRPQTVRSWEVGAKTDWLDQRLRANVNIFVSKYDDLQKFVSQTGPSGVSQLVTKNAAKATVKGIEVELAARPVSRVDLSLTVGYLDATYDEFFEDPIGNGVRLDLTDQRFPWTPEWTVNLATELDVYSGKRGSVDVGVNYDYKSSHSINSLDNPLTSQAAYGLLNASIRFRTASERYSVSLYGKNILDEEYFVVAETNSGLATMVLDGMPATWGISLGARF